VKKSDLKIDDGYAVRRSPHGVALFGPVPVGDFCALLGAWEKDWGGKALIASGVASALGASFAVARDLESLEAWRREIDERAARMHGDDAALRWLAGADTGISSVTICSVLASGQAANIAKGQAAAFGGSAPSDPDDLGRCVRLLDLIPGWRERMPEVASAYPEWAPLVERWGELEALVREEAPGWRGRAPRTYALMNSLLHPGRK
jgi:hypothetical protein